jgi:hypothetical protein
MILIAHRGNISEKSKWENHPDFLEDTVTAGYDIEVDLRYIDGKYYLGHDSPDYYIHKEQLQGLSPCMWCHAKDISTLHQLLIDNLHCFFHDSDDATLTSYGKIWTYPGKPLTSNSICVLPSDDWKIEGCLGICSDYISRYRSLR